MINTQIAKWYELLVKLQKDVGSDSFYATLSSTLKQVIKIDCSGVFFYNGCEVTIIYEDGHTPTYRKYIELYLEGLYLLDPRYSFLAKGAQTGLYRFSDIAPSCFQDSKYYKTFIKPVGISDEYDFIISINNCYVDFYLELLGDQFSKQDSETLELISPMITYLIEEHWHKCETNSKASTAVADSMAYQSIFDAFGKSILTKREQEVVQCILHGHSSKSLANKLNISPSTVKIHRKHIYQKLDITTQSELFSLCLQSLQLGRVSRSEDPLESLISKQVPKYSLG
jgi:DNA-binding CsgD family transcriptional regulator